MGTGDKTSADGAGGADVRAARLAEALRENLKKRKALTRARGAHGSAGAGGSQSGGETSTPDKGDTGA